MFKRYSQTNSEKKENLDDEPLLAEENTFHEFNKKQFTAICASSSRTCTENITKLVAECERLNSIAK